MMLIDIMITTLKKTQLTIITNAFMAKLLEIKVFMSTMKA